MAVEVANALSVPYRIVGSQKEVVKNVTCSTKYVEGGEVLTPANLGLNYVEPGSTVCNLKDDGEGTVNIANAFYDATTGKLVLRDETPGEVASEAEIKKPIIQVRARGH